MVGPDEGRDEGRDSASRVARSRWARNRRKLRRGWGAGTLDCGGSDAGMGTLPRLGLSESLIDSDSTSILYEVLTRRPHSLPRARPRELDQ